MPFDHQRDLDGDMSISKTEEACEIVQNAGFQLTDIRFDTKTVDGTVFRINKAYFAKTLFERLSDLHFVELGDDENEADVKADKTNNGWTYIFTSTIYSGPSTTKVMVFGRR